MNEWMNFVNLLVSSIQLQCIEISGPEGTACMLILQYRISTLHSLIVFPVLQSWNSYHNLLLSWAQQRVQGDHNTLDNGKQRITPAVTWDLLWGHLLMGVKSHKSKRLGNGVSHRKLQDKLAFYKIPSIMRYMTMYNKTDKKTWLAAHTVHCRSRLNDQQSNCNWQEVQ